MNLRRLWAIMLKELRQLRRDRITLAMIVGIPVMQLLLFGYAINLNLRHLDAGVADAAQLDGHVNHLGAREHAHRALLAVPAHRGEWHHDGVRRAAHLDLDRGAGGSGGICW